AISRSLQRANGGGSVFVVAAPIGGDQLLALFDVETFVRETAARFGGADGYALAIYDGDEPIFTEEPVEVEDASLRWMGHTANLLGVPWRVELAPLPTL